MNIMSMKPIKTTKPAWRDLFGELKNISQDQLEKEELITKIPILEEFYNLHLGDKKSDSDGNILKFLERYAPDAFSPDTGNEPRLMAYAFTDGNLWIDSKQYSDFVDGVYELYCFLVDEMIKDPDISLYRLSHHARAWREFSLDLQLAFPSPTFLLLGWPMIEKEEELWVQLYERTESLYGIRCFDLLHELCEALFCAVELLSIKKRGKGAPETQVVFNVCCAGETPKLPRCKNIFLQALKGCPKYFCSNGCRRRQHEFEKQKSKKRTRLK